MVEQKRRIDPVGILREHPRKRGDAAHVVMTEVDVLQDSRRAGECLDARNLVVVGKQRVELWLVLQTVQRGDGVVACDQVPELGAAGQRLERVHLVVGDVERLEVEEVIAERRNAVNLVVLQEQKLELRATGKSRDVGQGVVRGVELL